MRCHAALVAAGTALITVGGIPLGLANEPVPTVSASPVNVTTGGDSLKITISTKARHVTTNEWAIKAGPDAARITVSPGESAYAAQVVEVTHTGRTLTKFELSGTVIVENPAVTELTATVSTILAGTTCDVTEGVNRIVPAQGQLALSFVCEPGPGFQPGVSDITTASVSWQQGGTTHSLDTAAEAISWDGLYLHNTVDVHDIDGDELSVLGSLTVATDGTLQLLTPESGSLNGSSARFTYTAQLEGSPTSCRTYDTLAVVAGDEGEHVASDPASVAVCHRSAAPGLPHTGD